MTNANSLQEKILDRLNWLESISPGTIWTEYHWREIIQLRQELEAAFIGDQC